MFRKLAAAAAAGLIGGALMLAGTAHAQEDSCVDVNEDGVDRLRHMLDEPPDHVKFDVDALNAMRPFESEVHFRAALEETFNYNGGTWDEWNAEEWGDVISEVIAGGSGFPPACDFEIDEGKELHASHTLGDCEVTITFINNAPEHAGNTPAVYSADVRVDGEDGTPDQWTDDTIAGGPHEGELFGERYNPVRLDSWKTTETVSFEPESGEHTVAYRIWRGPENDWYVPWTEVTVDCGEPTAKPTEEPTEEPAPEKADEQLAVTGSSLPMLIGAGLVLLVGGGVAVTLARRRGLV